MMRSAVVWQGAALLAAALLSGCSTVENSHRQKLEMMRAYESGDNAAVLEEIGSRLREPAWYNTSAVDSGDEVMWRLEAGSMNFHLGKFRESIAEFRIAERLIGEYDDRAKVSLRDVGAEAGAAVTNLNALPYRGFCRDRMALSVYKSLAYLGVDDENAFRAQLRRLRNEQKKVQEDYREFFEKEKAELAAKRKENPSAAEKADSSASAAKLAKDPRNADFTAGLAEVRRIADRGYGNFLNPAAIFLSGLGSLRDGNPDNARIDFRRLYEAMPRNPLTRRWYATVLRMAERPLPAELEGVKPFGFPPDRDCVYVIFANGRSAAFRQIALYFPVMTAWPMCEFYPAPFSKARVSAGGGESADTEILADMDGILAQEFRERLPGMIARIVLSTLVKEGAYYGGLAAVQSSNMDPTVKAIVLLSVALGGAAYRTAMNTADTRSWEILPKEFQLAQLPMPESRELAVELVGGAAGNVRKVRLPEKCRSAIVFISAPSARNVRCHVLPMSSR